MSINKKYQRGFSLIELMIGITLGLLILAALSAVLVNNIQSRNDIERANQQAENGRYAAQVISDDLRLAGYLAELDPFSLPTPAAKPDPCATDLATLTTALPLAVQGYNNASSATLSCLSDVVTGSDILVVRRASTCAVGTVGCDAEITVNPPPYLQASSCSGSAELSSITVGGADFFRLNTNTSATTLDRHRKDCNPVAGVAGSIAPYQQYLVHIYFVANNDKPGDGIPTLKRADLTGGPSASVTCSPSGTPPCFSIVPLVQGIETMQFEYGIDTGAALATPAPTGTPGAFTPAVDSYSSCTSTSTPTCTAYWRNVVSARISLIARSTSKATGYDDSKKTYSLGLRANGTANTFTPPANDGYKRHVFQSIVRLNNVSGRNTPS